MSEIYDLNNEINGNQCIFSVDVEDGISIAMRDLFSKKIKPTSRVVTNTREILSICDKHEIKGTFFILGEVAEHFPSLVSEIDNSGHEIGLHGYDHTLYYYLNPDEAHNHLSRSKNIIEDITGKKVLGHRAPAFSLNRQTNWLFEILHELEFEYDSSVMPCNIKRYGWDGFSKDICEIDLGNDRRIVEVPMSVSNILKYNFPVLGGSYFRLLPFAVSDMFISQIIKFRTPVFYMHPYEIDVVKYPNYFTDEMKSLGFLKRCKVRSNWIGRKSVKKKLELLFERYKFNTIESILNQRFIDKTKNSYKLETFN